MSEQRRALGRGLGALIPAAPNDSARPVDLLFRDHPGPRPVDGERDRRPTAAEPSSVEPTGQLHPHGAYPQVSAQRGAAQEESPGGRSPAGTALSPVPGATFAELPVAAIRPNPRQPRTVFDEDELTELAHSIQEIGVLQPMVVRRVGERSDALEGVEFELIMGERRWRATRQAGIETIPAIIKDTQDDDLLRDALLENLHRSQLNPLEEAAAYRQLLDDFGCSHDELATRIGRSRPQISNTLRLLRLPPLVARRVAAGVLSAGHARALLSLEDAAAMERLAQRIVAEGLSVRSVEEVVSLGGDAAPRAREPRAGTRHPRLDEVAARLSDHVDTRVTITLGQRKGKLTVEFASVDDLDRIVGILGVPVEAQPA